MELTKDLFKDSKSVYGPPVGFKKLDGEEIVILFGVWIPASEVSLEAARAFWEANKDAIPPPIPNEFKVERVLRTWEIPSWTQKKVRYLVTLRDGHWHCTCKGYQFHHDCSHIAEAKKRWLAEKKPCSA